MDVQTALHTRRTVHRYRRGALPEGALDRALEAAIMAPNHRLTWPWRFTLVSREARAPLADLAVEFKAKPAQPCTAELEAKVRAKVLDPEHLVVVSLVRADNPMVAREDYAAAACAIQNLSLSLTAEGIGSKWSTGGVTRAAGTYAILDIDPETEEIIGFVWVGLPDCEPKTPERPPLETFVRRR